MQILIFTTLFENTLDCKFYWKHSMHISFSNKKCFLNKALDKFWNFKMIGKRKERIFRLPEMSKEVEDRRRVAEHLCSTPFGCIPQQLRGSFRLKSWKLLINFCCSRNIWNTCDLYKIRFGWLIFIILF
jgi:hypothetical protein